MSPLSEAALQRQNARNKSTGKYTVMPRSESGVCLESPGQEISAAQLLSSVAGTEADPRALPADPLAGGMRVSASINAVSAESAYSDYSYVAISNENNEYANSIPHPEDVPDNAVFELEEEVKGDRFVAPRLVAITPDGARTVLADFAEIEGNYEPVFALDAQDGTLEDLSSLRLVEPGWIEAAATSKKVKAETVIRSHALLEDLGWTLEPTGTGWKIHTEDGETPSHLIISAHGSIIQQHPFKVADAEDFAKLVDAPNVCADTADLIEVTLKAAAGAPSPLMEHKAARKVLTDRVASVPTVDRERLEYSRDMLAIVNGEKEAPRAGSLAWKAEEFETYKQKASIAKEALGSAQNQKKQFSGALDDLGADHPVAATVLREALETLNSSLGRLESKAAETQKIVDDRYEFWVSIVEKDLQYRNTRQKHLAAIEALDVAFDQQQGAAGELPAPHPVKS